MDALGDHNLPEYLTAWLEGGLDSAQVEQLREFVRQHPDAWEKFDEGIRLRGAARRVFAADPPTAPAELKQRIFALVDVDAPAAGFPIRQAYLSAAAAAAVALALGLFAGRYMMHPATVVEAPTRLPAEVIPVSDVIPAPVVVHAARVHADCSRMADRLHSAEFPKDAGSLATDVARDLRSRNPYPDLSKIGFRYIGAGPCGDPLPGTIHLLYKSTHPGSVAALSLFVQPAHGQYSLVIDHLYTVSDALDPFPMLAWRTEHVVYFLLADDDASEQKALAAIAPAPHLSTTAASSGPMK